MLEMFLLGLIVHSLQGSHLTHQDDSNQSYIEIKKLYDASTTAAAKRDVTGVLKDYGPDFRGVTKSGVCVSLSKMRSYTKTLFAASISVKASSTILVFTLRGNIAEVVVKEDATLVMRQSGTTRAVILESSEIDKDIWIRQKGIWVEHEAQVETISQKMNGKPVSE